jgi:hypothetical protein
VNPGHHPPQRPHRDPIRATRSRTHQGPDSTAVLQQSTH